MSCLLRRGRLRGAIASQFDGGERAKMVQVGVQRASQRRALVDQSDAGMTPTVDSALMTFGLAESSFQLQIVSRQYIDRSQEQPWQKACHQLHQVLNERILLLRDVKAEFFKDTTTVILGPLSRIEGVYHGLQLLHLRSEFVLNFLHGLQSAVNAVG